MAVRYDKATECTGGPTPGALAVRDHWRKVTGLGDAGIYNCRSVRGGATRSVHSEGRAVDLSADANSQTERGKADEYVAFLIDNADAIQCQYIIWNARSWKSGRGWQPYSGASAHTDHIHAELNRDGAEDVTEAQLDALWRRESSTPTSPPTLTLPEDPLAYTLDIHAFVEECYREAGRDPNQSGNRGGVNYWAMTAAEDDDPKGTLNYMRGLLGLKPID